jgi:hypothetical protein
MKIAFFWDVAPCGFYINRRFGGTCRLHLQGRRDNASEQNCQTVNSLTTVPRARTWEGEVGCGAGGCSRSEQSSEVWREIIKTAPGGQTLFLTRFTSTLKMGATRSYETSVYIEPTGRHIPEDGIYRGGRQYRFLRNVSRYIHCIYCIVYLTLRVTLYTVR